MYKLAISFDYDFEKWHLQILLHKIKIKLDEKQFVMETTIIVILDKNERRTCKKKKRT